MLITLITTEVCPSPSHGTQSHTNLLNVYIQIANKMGFKKNMYPDCLENVGASTSHNSMRLDGLIQG
jgi:hypothetical protein